jgi:micrococcal nuclease
MVEKPLRALICALVLVCYAAPIRLLLAMILLAMPERYLTGKVSFVRDGDTIVVGSMPIRLNGLARPEGDEPGGGALWTRWSSWSKVGPCAARSTASAHTDRWVGICYLEGVDIAAEMVRRGVAGQRRLSSAGPNAGLGMLLFRPTARIMPTLSPNRQIDRNPDSSSY